MSAVDVISPAKVNLGLDILGKRSDGFHEIRTVLAMIDLADHLQGTGGGTEIERLPAGMRRFGQAAGLMVMLGDREKLGKHGGAWGRVSVPAH